MERKRKIKEKSALFGLRQLVSHRQFFFSPLADFEAPARRDTRNPLRPRGGLKMYTFSIRPEALADFEYPFAPELRNPLGEKRKTDGAKQVGGVQTMQIFL